MVNLTFNTGLDWTLVASTNCAECDEGPKFDATASNTFSASSTEAGYVGFLTGTFFGYRATDQICLDSN